MLGKPLQCSEAGKSDASNSRSDCVVFNWTSKVKQKHLRGRQTCVKLLTGWSGLGNEDKQHQCSRPNPRHQKILITIMPIYEIADSLWVELGFPEEGSLSQATDERDREKRNVNGGMMGWDDYEHLNIVKDKMEKRRHLTLHCRLGSLCRLEG